MNQKKKQNPFWHLAGPLLGYWVIQLVAEIIVSMLVMLPYAAKYLSLVMNHASEMNYTDVVNKYYMETMQPGLELVLKYATEINGVTALFTLILTVSLFRLDRKKEKQAGIPQRQKVSAGNYLWLILMGAAGSIGVTCLSVVAQLAMNSNSYQQSVQSTYAAPNFCSGCGCGDHYPGRRRDDVPGGSVSQIQRDKGLLLCGTVVIGFLFGDASDDDPDRLCISAGNPAVLCL